MGFLSSDRWSYVGIKRSPRTYRDRKCWGISIPLLNDAGSLPLFIARTALLYTLCVLVIGIYVLKLQLETKRMIDYLVPLARSQTIGWKLPEGEVPFQRHLDSKVDIPEENNHEAFTPPPPDVYSEKLHGHFTHFAVIANPEFGALYGGSHWQTDRSILSSTLSRLQSLPNGSQQPGLIVIMGNFVHTSPDPSTRPLRAAQISDFKSVISEVPGHLNLRLVPGDKDVGSAPTPESIQNYESNFGPSYSHAWHGKHLFLFLNSPLLLEPQNAPHLALAQVKWLKQMVFMGTNERAKEIFIFSQTPFLDANRLDPDRAHASLTSVVEELLATPLVKNTFHSSQDEVPATREISYIRQFVTPSAVRSSLSHAPEGQNPKLPVVSLINLEGSHVEHTFIRI